MNRWNYLLIIALLLTLSDGCKSGSSTKELKRAGLTLQVKVLPGETGDASTISYAARLVPDKGLVSDNLAKTNLQFRMDSTFYIQSGKERIYASLIQPVANGITGTYEYLVSFEDNHHDLHSGKLIYQDKYINHQKYTISLN